MNAMSTGRISRGRPLRKAAPATASTTTTNRLTANPCASSNRVKAVIQLDRTCGCDVGAIALVMPARVPGWPCAVPCQNPRPGQACSMAIPARKSPVPARVSLPSRRLRQVRSGSAISAPAIA